MSLVGLFDHGDEDNKVIQYPPIFKRTQKGAVQQWSAEIEGGKFRTTAGQVDGKKSVSKWTECLMTNPGKANQRTPHQQAVFEVDAMYEKKLKTEYHETVDTIDTPKIRVVQTCKDYDDHKHKLDFERGVYVQPKLDGFRTTTPRKIHMQSRKGETFYPLNTVADALKKILPADSPIIVDGELYNHAYKSDFDTLASVFKKKTPTPAEIVRAEKITQIHLYDLFAYPGDFAERYEMLRRLVSDVDTGGVIQLVQTIKVNTFEEIDHWYKVFLDDGYEGMIIRQNLPYEKKRSDHALKRKPWKTAEYILVDITEGKGDWSGHAKSALLKLDPTGDESKENTFRANITGTQEFTKEILDNRAKYIGTWCTVERSPQLTPGGKPRFARVKEFDRQDIEIELDDYT